MAGEREAEKPGIAMLATKRPEENAGEDSFFQEPFPSRYMDSFAATFWTLHDGESPDAKLASQAAKQASLAGAQGVCLLLDTTNR
jgi:hypothetical protein